MHLSSWASAVFVAVSQALTHRCTFHRYLPFATALSTAVVYFSATPAPEAQTQNLPPACVQAFSSPERGVEGTPDHDAVRACTMAYAACIFSPEAFGASGIARETAIRHCMDQAVAGGVSLPSGQSVQRGTQDELHLCRTANNAPVTVAFQACTDVINAGGAKPGEIAEAHAGRAAVYIGQQKLDQALADCNEAIRLDPKSALCFFIRGAIESTRVQFDPAIEDLSRAIDLNLESDEMPRALNFRGTEFAARGDSEFHANQRDQAAKSYTLAIADFEKVIKLDPTIASGLNGEYADALYRRGEIEKANGQAAKADEDMDAARKINPKISD